MWFMDCVVHSCRALIPQDAVCASLHDRPGLDLCGNGSAVLKVGVADQSRLSDTRVTLKMLVDHRAGNLSLLVPMLAMSMGAASAQIG